MKPGDEIVFPVQHAKKGIRDASGEVHHVQDLIDVANALGSAFSKLYGANMQLTLDGWEVKHIEGRGLVIYKT